MDWTGKDGEEGISTFKGLLIHVSAKTQTAIVIQMGQNRAGQISLRLITPLPAI